MKNVGKKTKYSTFDEFIMMEMSTLNFSILTTFNRTLRSRKMLVKRRRNFVKQTSIAILTIFFH